MCNKFFQLKCPTECLEQKVTSLLEDSYFCFHGTSKFTALFKKRTKSFILSQTYSFHTFILSLPGCFNNTIPCTTNFFDQNFKCTLHLHRWSPTCGKRTIFYCFLSTCVMNKMKINSKRLLTFLLL